MVAEPNYRQAAIHRTAALADSRLVYVKPTSLDDLLGGRGGPTCLRGE
jgi:hypothetical protein